MVHALAGTGKSEMARKYAEVYRSYYGGNCVWIKSSSKESLESSFTKIAELCELPIKDANGNTKSIDYIVNEVHKHLRMDAMLYIFDDVVDQNDIRDFLPDYPSSVTIITS